jgi:diguanylate cyclase (GGDEF)-like protein
MMASGGSLGQEISHSIFAELARVGTQTALPPGAVLWKEGEPGGSVAFLIEGTLEVVNTAAEDQEVVLRTMEAGTIVGELSSEGARRSATVRARSTCRIIKVPAADFRRLLDRRPDILLELYRVQVERVRDLTREVTKTHRQAITDPLTKLYNVGFFRERLDIEVDRARETGDQLCVVLFDIDHFKHFNDTNGHEEGNVVLSTLASLMKGVGRRGDILARYGGEEFIALLYGAGREEAARFAESVRHAIEGHAFRGGEKQPGGRVTVSGGVAVFPEDAAEAQPLIEAADRNLYRAKEAGRNRIVSAAA